MRSGYVSNTIGGYVSESLGKRSNLHLGAGRFYINPFPLFIGARDISLTDKDGQKIASVEKVKAYFDFTAIFSGKIGTHRVVIERPVLNYRYAYSSLGISGKGVTENKGPSGWRGALIIRDGQFSYDQDNDKPPLIISGVDAELSVGDKLWALFSIKSLKYDIPGQDWPEITTSINGRMKYYEHTLEIDALSAFIGESVFRVGGEITGIGESDMKGDLDVSTLVKIRSLEEAFGLKRNADGEIRSEGTIVLGPNISDTLLDITLEGDFYLETLLDALRHSASQKYSGRIQCNGSLKGPLLDLQGRADAVISGSEIQGLRLDRATAVVTYGNERLNISEGKADLYDGYADVDVSFGVRGNSPFDLSVIFRDVESQPMFERINIGHIGLPDGRVKGEFHSDGMDFSPYGRVRFQGDIRHDTPLGRMNYFSGRFHSDGGVLMLDGFDLRSQNTHVSFDGHIDLNGPGIGFNGYAISTDLSDVLVPFDFGFRAGGRIDINVKGTTDDPRISITSSLWDTSFREYMLGEVELSADYRKELLAIRKLKATGQGSSHQASGEIGFPEAEHLFSMEHPDFNIQVSAGNSDIGGLLSIFVNNIDINGRVDTEARLRGTLSALDIQGHANIREVTAYGRIIDSGSFDYYLKNDKLGIGNSQFARDESKVHAHGYWALDGSYSADIVAENTWLSYLVPEMNGADFKMNMTVSGKGRTSEPSLLLDADLIYGRVMNVPVHNGHLRGKLEGGMAEASLDMMDDYLSAKGSMNLKENLSWGVDLSLEYDRYDHILRYFVGSIPKDVILAMGGNISLKGDRDHVYASVRLERANTTVYGQGFANIGPFEIDIADKLIEFRKVKMRGAHVNFDMLGSMNIGNDLDINIISDASLLPFARYLPAVSQLRGNSRIDIKLVGPWEKPEMSGDIEIADASVAFKGIPQRLSSINSHIVLDKGKVLVKHASAKVGGGDVQVSGNLALNGFRVEDINLEALIRSVSARLSTHFNTDLDGYLLLAGDADGQDLSGEIAVTGALYREKMDWRAMLLGGKREVPKGSIQWRENVKLSIRLYGHENISVDNNLANAPLRGDLFVKGTLASPLLIGRVEAVGGKVFFRNSDLDIVSATADYSDTSPGRPVVNMSARTDIRGYEIWLNMQGQADRMDLEMASDPPLDDNEILALLTYGDIGSGYGALGSGLGAAEAASIVAGEIGLTEIMEERGALYTGLDRIQIDPYLSRSTGSVTPRLTVSKKLLEDKLYLTYASTLDAASEKEVKLEYLFGENVSIIGGQDYTGSVGGDLKFRFRFE
ncbi:translocation/assembly module TamB domain-containing protein [Nitrospirota bacterium]